MGFQLNTDFSTIQPNAGGGGKFPVSDPKKGWLCRIVESTTKENSKKTGTVAVFKLLGMEPGVDGQTHDLNINVANPNQQAVDIGFGEISAIAHCIGVLRVGNSAELHEKPFRVLVRQQKDDERYTEVYGFRDVNGNEPGKAGQGPLTAQPAQGGFGGGAPQGGGFTPGGGQPAQGGFTPGAGQQQPQGGGQWNGGAPQGGQPATDPNAGGYQQQPQGGGWQGQPTGAPQGGQAPQGGNGWQAGGGAPGWAATPGR